MIKVGSQISAKCRELISNPQDSQYRQVRERLFSNVLSSGGGSKCSIKFDNRMTKEMQSNALRLKE